MAKVSRKIPKLIVLAGVSRSGKDSFFQCLYRYFNGNPYGPHVQRVSLGDYCKKNCDEFCKQQFGISAFTSDPTEKELIRPIIVESVKIKKKQNPDYYINLVKPEIKKILKEKNIPVCTDGRYPEEVKYFKKLGAILIYVQRNNEFNVLLPPANAEEAKHDEFLRENANFILTWPTLKSPDAIYDYSLQFLQAWFE